MSANWTDEELALITEASKSRGGERDAIMDRLIETFGTGFKLAEACGAADRLSRIGEAVDVGNGEQLMRSVSVGGSVIADKTVMRA